MPKNKFKKSQTHQSQSQSQRLNQREIKELRGRERLRLEGEKELARAAWARVAWVARGLGLHCLARAA